MKKITSYSRDFLLVVAGQIISLFGNQILVFILPLYLLNQTHSAVLFGFISAAAFLPLVVLCPIGGIMADRLNKRNIMVFLDFSTSLITLLLALLLGRLDLSLLVLIALVLFYAIQGTYQPAVTSSIPALVPEENLVQANAAITLVNAMAGLLGPIIGGSLYAFFGIYPILIIGIICFFASAVMELFIHIPFIRRESQENIFRTGYGDLKESFYFIRKKQPTIWKVSLIVALINLFLSSLIIIGLPVIITQYLDFSVSTGNRLYGYAQGIMGLGSLAGGIMTGVLSRKLKVGQNPWILTLCGLSVLIMGVATAIPGQPMISFCLLALGCFILFFLVSLFSIQMMAYLQMMTPPELTGKVISCAMCIGMCSHPLGQAFYGTLFELFASAPSFIFYLSAVITVIIALFSRNVFRDVEALFVTDETSSIGSEILLGQPE